MVSGDMVSGDMVSGGNRGPRVGNGTCPGSRVSHVCEHGGMKPGERIRLITESADSLLKRPWAKAQLTLDQFGFQTYEPDKYRDDYDELSYFVQAIKEGGDNLLELHKYLLGEDAAPTPQHESDHP
jgi:hypothetical protein